MLPFFHPALGDWLFFEPLSPVSAPSVARCWRSAERRRDPPYGEQQHTRYLGVASMTRGRPTFDICRVAIAWQACPLLAKSVAVSMLGSRSLAEAFPSSSKPVAGLLLVDWCISITSCSRCLLYFLRWYGRQFLPDLCLKMMRPERPGCNLPC